MATEKFVNAASTTLNGTIMPGDLSLVVANAGPFSLTPQFRILIENEILLVTGVSGTTFTVARGQEGTTAVSHNNGVTVTAILTAGALAQFKDDINRATSLLLALVAGVQSVNTTGYTVLGCTPALNWDTLGRAASRVYYITATLDIPTGSTAQVQLYDVTNATALYTSGVISGPQTNNQIITTFTPAAGSSALEFWLAAPTNTGGPVTCKSAHIAQNYQS